jgi:hypothetical protein
MNNFLPLLGAGMPLRRFRPVVVAELNSVCLSRDHRTPNDVLRLLCEAGYRCKRTEDGVIATPLTVAGRARPYGIV